MRKCITVTKLQKKTIKKRMTLGILTGNKIRVTSVTCPVEQKNKLQK